MNAAAMKPIERRLSPELWATLLILLAYIVWLLSMPAWPSQDGPVHLYYTHVLGALLSHRPTVYAGFFMVKHVLPPYALYYYLLLALGHFVPLLLADRLIVCAYAVSFVFGFRYLARKLGPGADATTLLATLLLLNWPLGMGFINYCLSLSFAFWAVGLWLRFGGSHDTVRRVCFVLLTAAITLTHPVPLLLVLAVCSVLLVFDLFPRSSTGRAAAAPRNSLSARYPLRDLLTLALASLSAIYVKLFATSHPLQQVLPEQGSFVSRLLHRTFIYAHEDGLTLLYGHLPTIWAYRIALGLILLASIALAIHQLIESRSSRNWSPSLTFFALGLALLVALPIIPPEMNGLFYFADRLPLLVWVALLLAASGSSVLSRSSGAITPRSTFALRTGVIAFALIANTALLMAAETVLRPVAREIADVNSAPRDLSGQSGFILEDPRTPVYIANAPSWDPFYWAAIHIFRTNDAILANAPWMDETILPVGPTSSLAEQRIPALRTPQPTHVYQALMDAPLDRAAAFASSGFFVVSHPDRPPADSVADLFPGEFASHRWSCQSTTWYTLCRRLSSSDHPS